VFLKVPSSPRAIALAGDWWYAGDCWVTIADLGGTCRRDVGADCLRKGLTNVVRDPFFITALDPVDVEVVAERLLASGDGQISVRGHRGGAVIVCRRK
jgi:hypothetical protein